MPPGVGAPLMRITRGDASILVYTLPMMLHRQGSAAGVRSAAVLRPLVQFSWNQIKPPVPWCIPGCSIAGVEMACPTYMMPPPVQAEMAEGGEAPAPARVLVPRQAIQRLQQRGVAFRLAWS